jgi:hypothetical protein
MPRSQSGEAYLNDPLASWNEGPTKRSIVDFVARVTAAGGVDYVAPEERIATFDNDGTLWSERPYPFQIAFALDQVKAMAPQECRRGRAHRAPVDQRSRASPVRR